MAVYAIVQLEINDPDGYAEYAALLGPQIAKHGGRVLVRSSDVENLESEWNPGTLVVIEFPTMADFRAFYDAEEYQPLIAMRERTSKGVFSVVEGL